MTRNLSIILMTALALGGCAPKTVPKTEPDPVLVSIANKSRIISEELAELRGIEQSRQRRAGRVQHAIATSDVPKHGALLNLISFQWNGPVQPAVESIAQMIGYSVEIEGRVPPQPIVVHIDAQRKAAYRVLANMGWQMGDSAGIAVNQKTQTIQVLYVGD